MTSGRSRESIALAMTGASGAQYGLRLLECLLATGPAQVGDLVDYIVARILDQLGIDQSLMPPWGAGPDTPVIPGS